ncbi:MAG: MogA/MoaB family molybdenum cofactor biosynthesis protein [Thermoplasmata archaeon]|nr:MogA/MoaB family molybdenum cofactor biosynthesis protein [Thermoplasmata archaeon]
MGADEHRKTALKRVVCAVITVSDTRTEQDDASGKEIMKILEKHGHSTKLYDIVKDDIAKIKEVMRQCIEDDDVQAIIFNGGTGVTRRDNTIEALREFAEKELSGFGELFRMLSYQEIGAAAMLSRAFSFVTEKKAVFALPGSTAAVRLAMDKLIAPELGHVLSEANR